MKMISPFTMCAEYRGKTVKKIIKMKKIAKFGHHKRYV